MRYIASDNLRALTLALLLVFLVVSVLAFLPQIADLHVGQLRVLIIGFSGAVLLLGMWATRQTNRRLVRLSQVAKAIEQGDYSARSVVVGGDSIAQLSGAINQMAQRTEEVIGDLQERTLEIQRLSTHDLQTGLPNRRLFHEILLKELAHARRDSQKLGVILLDLDGFKDINDGLGHDVGDHILRELAERLRIITREADTLARQGGDEFALLVSGADDVPGIKDAMQRIWQVFERPFEIGDPAIRISASAGIGVFPDHGETPEQLVGQAESALQWVKGRGGKRWEIFDSSMDRQARTRLKLEQDFHRADRGKELLVHYQPICAVGDGRIEGFEALVRWNHPESGLMTAGRFIPTLEQAGLMPELGAWLWEEICRQAVSWQESGLPAIPISVNVSVRQFQAGDVAEVAAAALAKSGLSPDFLHLEITETIAMHDIGQMIDHLERCRELGVKIHLDDFGTGYSSLSYLLQFPVDVLKIDRSFVSGVPDNPHSVAIVKATLALARSLGLRVIAEGLETEEQLQFLRSIDCELAQGYLLGRPVSATDTRALLEAGRVTLTV